MEKSFQEREFEYIFCNSSPSEIRELQAQVLEYLIEHKILSTNTLL